MTTETWWTSFAVPEELAERTRVEIKRVFEAMGASCNSGRHDCDEWCVARWRALHAIACLAPPVRILPSGSLPVATPTMMNAESLQQITRLANAFPNDRGLAEVHDALRTYILSREARARLGGSAGGSHEMRGWARTASALSKKPSP